MLQLKFDSSQQYQLEAVESVISLFEGQPLVSSGYDFPNVDNYHSSLLFSEFGIANSLGIDTSVLLQNLSKIQYKHGFSPDEISKCLEYIKFSYQEPLESNSILDSTLIDFPNFSVEMETGTGKTYVYLRTIFELNRVYGFTKFVIVVPSIAIREGVVKTLDITRDHFAELYDNQPVDYRLYDPKQLNSLYNFAKSNAIQILVINIDSFTQDYNIINQVSEFGIKPIEYIKNVRPIVILDEPQNMETDIRKRAVCSLNPLFTLRYSATHKNYYNLIYRLDPVKAYDLGLVKQIEVDSVVSKHDNPNGFVSLDGFVKGKGSLKAKISIYVNDKKGIHKKSFNIKSGDDLFALSNGLPDYESGFVVNVIDSEIGYISLSSGMTLYRGQSHGGLTDHILRSMIDAAVENHFRKELALRNHKIKVLSLFFIDRVSNYRSYDSNGNVVKGKFAQWFEESFNKWSAFGPFKNLITFDLNELHGGYFSQDHGRFKDSKEGRTNKADDDAYQLIMKDKERLLDLATPLRFIFSHSALREGWDNPNIFQICTLNETKSDTKKRQEIGRGLRLCVDHSGNRIFDPSLNRLTVIANESYESFARSLQKELADDCGVNFEGRIKNARTRTKVYLKDKWLDDSLFLQLWDRIKQKTVYNVRFDSSILIANCINRIALMERIPSPKLVRSLNRTVFDKSPDGDVVGIGKEEITSNNIDIPDIQYSLPDIVTYLHDRTLLTKKTIVSILRQCNRLSEFFNNPQLFLDSIVSIIKNEFDKLKINGIEYHKVSDCYFAMHIFNSEEIEHYLENLVTVKNQTKTLFNYIHVDSLSTPEINFAKACDSREDILFYIKLPRQFVIDTPIGPYNPDWALIKQDAESPASLYFVAETKDSKSVVDFSLLRESERLKIACAKKHFSVIDEVRYRVVSSVAEL